MNDITYTTEEVAKLLKVSKLTVYDLIKKGELPAYRVGKQMRIDALDLEQYKSNTKNDGLSRQSISNDVTMGVISPSSALDPTNVVAQSQRTLVITGQDLSLDLLARNLEKMAPTYRSLRSHDGSLNSLISMYRGQSDIVSSHLLDGDSGEYNIPYVTKILAGHSYMVVNLLQRIAGLYVRKGNPHNLQEWSDLSKPGITLINREKGSGARVLLDEQLRIHGIDRNLIKGYVQEETGHMGISGRVSAGTADVGVGIQNAVSLFNEVEFIPLIKERYDLVVLKKPQNMEWIAQLLQILRSSEFRQELLSIQGYDLSLTGQILYET